MRVGAASELMRIEIMKNGKLPTAARYKQIMKKKFEENKAKALANVSTGFKIPGNFKEAKKMSKRAENTLKEIAHKKAVKEAKALRKMVIVQPKVFSNGSLTKDGRIYDIAGNLVARVNVKDGKMSTMSGWSLGKYNPKSAFTSTIIQHAINQFSPYFIKQRQLQLMQQQGVQVIDVHGVNSERMSARGSVGQTIGHFQGSDALSESYGSDIAPARQNVGMTAWGARSDNIWGSFGDNTWGTFADNVWGGNFSDVWGGVGTGSMWGQKGPNIWGTGNGSNFLRSITGFLGGLLGFSTKKNRERLTSLTNAARANGGGSVRPASAPTARR